jgi:hypothetical protein
MAAPSIPPGGTYFDTIKKSFVDVPVDKEKDNAISTEEFLEAAESLTTLFGKTSHFLVRCLFSFLQIGHNWKSPWLMICFLLQIS